MDVCTVGFMKIFIYFNRFFSFVFSLYFLNAKNAMHILPYFSMILLSYVHKKIFIYIYYFIYFFIKRIYTLEFPGSLCYTPH